MFKKEKILVVIMLIVCIFTSVSTVTPKSYLFENKTTEIEKVEVKVEEKEEEERLEVEKVEEEIIKTEKVENWIELPVYTTGRFKAYMDGCCITDTTSPAWAQLQKMWVDENGCYREGEYVGIAVASFYGDIGDKFKITLSSGDIFYGVMTDTKQAQHVDASYADTNGGVIEFIVDTGTLREDARFSGSLDCIYEGDILKIERLENNGNSRS